MKKKSFLTHLFSQPTNAAQAGQSIVLIALALVGVVAFMGIAVDVGFVFARGSQLQAAIDSAALAGVTELSGWSSNNSNNPQIEADARTKSGQFLNANNMPVTVTLSLNEDENLHVEQSALGAVRYSITGTWPVETYFLRAIGFEEPIHLSRSATAAIFSLANVYASRRIEDGVISTSNQAVFGQNACTGHGDAFSPINSTWAPGEYTYKYRIMIPADYPHDTIRVEIFDPDSINANNIGAITIPRTQAAFNAGLEGSIQASCPSGNPSNRKNTCLIPTGELQLYEDGILPLERINPYYFWRIDENRGSGPVPGNGNCGEPNNYNAGYNTRTRYALSYWQQQPDGVVIEKPLVSYTGQVGDGARDNGNHCTDLQWVTPGAAQSYDFPSGGNCLGSVPVDAGSPHSSFEINLNTDVPGILVEPGSGIRYLNLNVTALDGSSENGFEFWAGPPHYIDTVPGDANARNLHVLDTPGSHSSKGVTIFASGVLPMNANFGTVVDVPLVYVGADYAGQELHVSMFDSDSGAQPPIMFFFDTISEDDWSFTFARQGYPDPDGGTGRCSPGNCNGIWVNPPYRITVPGGSLDDCDYSDPQGDPNCVPFYGGRLTARYRTGQGDTYVWQITVNGLPYLEQ